MNSAFLRLRSVGDQEPAIQIQFACLVEIISIALNTPLFPDAEKRVVVGAMLVWEELNVCGKTGPFFRSANDRPMLASEVKTNSAFPLDTFWHRGSHTSQILAWLYALACTAVLFRCNLHQMQFASSFLRMTGETWSSLYPLTKIPKHLSF